MKKKWIGAAALLTLLLTAWALWQSTRIAASNTRLLGGTLWTLEGEWSEEISSANDTRLVCYTCRLPENVALPEAYLYLNAYGSAFRVLVDGEPLYTHQGVKDGYGHIASLADLCGGETLTIEFYLGGTDSFITLQGSTFYLGNQASVASYILREDIYVFTFCFVAAFLVVSILALSILFRKILSQAQLEVLLTLSGFILLAGVWVLTDSRLLLLATTRTAVVALLSFLSFFAMPLFMLRFLRLVMELGDRFYHSLMLCYTLVLELFIVNYLTGAFNVMALSFAEHLLSVPTLVGVWHYGLRQLRQTRDRDPWLVLCGFTGYGVGVIVMMVTYYFQPFSNYTRPYILGILFFIVFLFAVVCRSVYGQMQRSVDLEVRARLAYVDVMTNIGNRAAFHEQQQLDREAPGSVAYVMADINNLKITNDTEGHSSGDKIIIRAARCLQEAAGEKGTCYRLGGDEFVVRLKDVTMEEAERCLKHFYELVDRANADSELELSIAGGLAWTDAVPKDLDALLNQADAAMYREKQKIKGKQAVPLEEKFN